MKDEKALKLIKNKQKEHANLEHAPITSSDIQKAQLVGFLHQKIFDSKDVFKELININQDF